MPSTALVLLRVCPPQLKTPRSLFSTLILPVTSSSLASRSSLRIRVSLRLSNSVSLILPRRKFRPSLSQVLTWFSVPRVLMMSASSTLLKRALLPCAVSLRMTCAVLPRPPVVSLFLPWLMLRARRSLTRLGLVQQRRFPRSALETARSFTLRAASRLQLRLLCFVVPTSTFLMRLSAPFMILFALSNVLWRLTPLWLVAVLSRQHSLSTLRTMPLPLVLVSSLPSLSLPRRFS
mmetsp:Transcript_21942/g.35213  ORF Transcript_21942/g.35213 Transcript_21942/m.35213 type:complete len:234 (-) Transcript_21942:945-1646(-)